MEDANTNKKSVNPVLIVVGIIVVVLIAIPVVMNMKKGSVVPSSDSNSSQDTSQTTPTGPVKEFTVDGSNFAFVPSTITVNKGDTVKINFKDNDGRHDLVVDGYNVKTDIIDQGSSASVQFVADKSGSFSYYCSVGSHRAQGMEGTLIVKDTSSGS